MSAYLPVHPGVYYHYGLAVTPRRGMPKPDGCNVYGSTFTLGRVVFQVFGSTVDELADLSRHGGPRVDQLRPYRAAFTWTPAPALDDAGLQWFAQGIYQELCALPHRVVD